MSEQPTPIQNTSGTWAPPVPFETEGSLPSPESLLEGPIYALWHEPNLESTEMREQLGWVEVCFPTVGTNDAYFSGNVYNQRYFDSEDDEPPVKIMEAGTVLIPRELEGHKLGEKLVRALVYEAVRSGCEEIKVDFKHLASFKAFLGITGFDKMTFSDKFGVSNLTEEQMLERITGDQPKGYRPKLMNVRSTEASIDIKGLDISAWEAPEVFQVPVEADEW